MKSRDSAVIARAHPTNYPDAILFEAFDPGPDPAMRDTQWQSLRLLFEQEQSRWYLVAVAHGHWTI